MSHLGMDVVHSSKPTVLIIVTGGTICMVYSGISDSLRPSPLAKRLQEMPDLKDSSLPNFEILEWESPIDSSDMTLAHWVQIACSIEKNYHKYDGFVILHGTDTLAYTASALSFMLENLNKPVILTGSMLPMCHIQTDARKNLAVALMIGAYSQITEVCILFGSRLLRGNRARKLDCSKMDAFDSPNFPALGQIGVDVTIDDQLLLTPSKRGFRIYTNFCMNIVVVTITPEFQPTLLQQLFALPTRPLGIILQLYGTGTAPMKNTKFLETVRMGIRRDVEIVCLTQCPSGRCSLLTYESGALLYHLGIIEGKDMTPETAFAKLAYLMGKGYSGEDLRVLMERDIRGEITERPTTVTGQGYLTVAVTQRGLNSPATNQLENGKTRFEETTNKIPVIGLEVPEDVKLYESDSYTSDLVLPSLSSRENPLKSPMPSSSIIQHPEPSFDLLLGKLRHSGYSAPNLHPEFHGSIHTYSSERKQFGYDHYEVPDRANKEAPTL